MNKTCVVSGTGGYLGSRVKSALEQAGWTVTELTRTPRPGANSASFKLGEDVPVSALRGATALVHCAYDFKPLRWPEIDRVNVAGSGRLFQAAAEAGIQRIIYISSISAFEGCRSLYGRAKLQTEALALARGAVVLRPGLIYGDCPGGMYGRLVAQVEKSQLLPLIGGGGQIQYLVHESDLTLLIANCLASQPDLAGKVITVANDRGWTFRQVLEEIAKARGKSLRFLPVPWRMVWTVLKLAELAGHPLDFRSDSLVSLMYQNPRPSFDLLRQAGFKCRAFAG